MVNLKLFARVFLVVLFLSCGSQKTELQSQERQAPASFDREACLKEKMKAYLSSNQTFMDTTWYYQEPHQLPFPSYLRYADSLKKEGDRLNIPVVGLYSDEITIHVTKEMLLDTPLQQAYFRRIDSMQALNRIMSNCFKLNHGFLLDSLGLDPNQHYTDNLSEEDKLKWEYLYTSSNLLWGEYQKLAKKMGDWTILE